MQKVDIIQHPFMIKPLSKGRIESTYLNIIKAMYDKPTASITMNKTTSVSLKIGHKTTMSAFITLM